MAIMLFSWKTVLSDFEKGFLPRAILIFKSKTKVAAATSKLTSKIFRTGLGNSFCLTSYRNVVECIQDQLRRDKITQLKNGLAQYEFNNSALLSDTVLRSSYVVYKAAP
jgi:hypothetical protein